MTETTHQPDAHITLQDKIDIQRMQDANGNHQHSMIGFTPRYADIVDYIIGVTHEIWEEKAVGKLYDYYANTIEIHTASGTLYGREAVMAGTLATLAAYPDRRLYGDEVIWGGDDRAGFYTSHRLVHTGTNRGWSLYGPPTNKRVEYYAVADCRVKQNVIVEEWLVRDELTLVHQLGLDPLETAREIARKEAASGAVFPTHADVERGVGQYPPPPPPEPPGDGFEPEAFVRRVIHEVWNWRMLNAVRRYYAADARFDGPSLRRLHGHNAIQGYALALLAPFPNLAVTVEHFCHVADGQGGWRTATRWRMRGTHTGYGVYGEPTGNPIDILGVSHHLIRDGQVHAEWTLFDEFALLKQLHRPAG